MSMDYIRRTYGVPAKRGGRVLIQKHEGVAPWPGVITSAGLNGRINIRFTRESRARTYHPTDTRITYLTEPAEAGNP